MNVSLLDVFDRAQEGPFCAEKDWDMRVIPEAVAEQLEKYELKGTCDPQNPINCDDSLADRFWEAGLEMAFKVGMLCTETERVVEFTREEILHGLREAPNYWRAGVGLDARDLKARKPEDLYPPITILGPFGTVITEELFIPIMQSHSQNWSVDGIVPGSLTTVYGRELRSGTPFETLGGAHESWLTEEALKRAGRPGMPVMGVATSPTEYGVMGGMAVPGGVTVAQSFVPCLFPSELKFDYHLLQKITYCHTHNIVAKSGHWSMIGGYSGSPEGCVVSAIAASILQSIAFKCTVIHALVFDPRYLGNCGRDAVWAGSVTQQARSRNAHMLDQYPVNPVSGALTEMILREVTVGALSGTVSGAATILGVRTAGGKFPLCTTGLETGYAGEVIKAAAGMTREQANEIVKQLMPKYEDELKRPNKGSTFPECFDVKTVKPTKEWQSIYRKIKKEVAALGVPFPRFE